MRAYTGATRRGVTVGTVLAATMMCLSPGLALANGSPPPPASGDLHTVFASGNGYALQPPVATSASFPGSPNYAPKPPSEGQPCIDITPIPGNIVHLMNSQGDAGTYTPYAIDVVPTLTGGPTTYNGTVTVSLPDGQSQTMPIQPIITTAADEQNVSSSVASSYNTAFQTEVSALPLIGSLLSNISPYTAADFPVSFAPVSAGSVIHAEDVGTWVPHVTVYLSSIPLWHYHYDWVDNSVSPPKSYPDAGPNPPVPGATLVNKYGAHCDPLHIVNVDVASAQQPVPAVVPKNVPPLLTNVATNLWASFQWGSIDTLPKSNVGGAGTVSTFVNVPTYAWLQPAASNPLPRVQYNLQVPPMTVGAMANAPVNVTEYWEVSVTPDVVQWNFDGSGAGPANSCAAGAPQGYGNQPPHAPSYDAVSQTWNDGAGGPPSNLDPVVHQYATVTPPGHDKTIDACQVFHFEILGLYNDGVSAAPQVIADVKYDEVATWSYGPVAVQQIEGVPVFH